MKHAPQLLALGVACGCGGEPGSAPPPSPALIVIHGDPSDVPVHGLSAEWTDRFFAGDALFGETHNDADGIGPLYIRSSCGACHDAGARGPGFVQKFSTPGFELPFGSTRRPFATAGATQAIEPPPGARVTTRLPPSVFGRGYMEAVADAELLRVEAEQGARADGIRGRAHHVAYVSEISADLRFPLLSKGDVAVGKFGLKARVATLDDFTADAYQGDMGLTAPLRPTEPRNPDGLLDDDRPGIDLGLDVVSDVAAYMRTLAIPERDAPSPRATKLFAAAKCAVCHVPSLRTRDDWPVPQLAGIDAPIYSDLLLHDMGEELSDGITDGDAGPREWKTAPLIGLRHQRALMHDGRAKTVEAAIDSLGADGSQAAGSVAAFRALSAEDRELLVAFVRGL